MDIPYNGLNAISYDTQDYTRMFSLGPHELKMKTLLYYAHVDAFTSERAKAGQYTVSCDPFYQKSLAQIMTLTEKAQTAWLEAIEKNQGAYSLTQAQAKAWVANRRKNAALFFEDFQQGVSEGRYVTHQLPHLPFDEDSFDIALVSHYFFTHGDRLSSDFHVKAIQELLRVANEVRIFPLTKREGGLSNLVGEVSARLQALDFGVELKSVPFEIQKQGNAMLRVLSPSCQVNK